MRNGKQQDLTLNMAQISQDAEQLLNGGGGDGAPQSVPGGEAVPPQGDLSQGGGRED
jgi:hypothetical protein